MPDKLKGSQYTAAAEAISRIYHEYGLTLHPQSGLGKMVLAAKDVEGRHPDAQVSTRAIFDAITAIEISKMLPVLNQHPQAAVFLRKLVNGNLSSYDPGPSVAKDTLWEIEVCSKMKAAGFAAELNEPDVIWRGDEGPNSCDSWCAE